MGRLGRATWACLGIVLALLAAANLACWRPGVGERRTRPGTEVEMYYGWPSTYRAELWDSDDPGLAGRVLEVAPFYHPVGEMDLRVRGVGPRAVVVDLAFAASALVAVGVASEASRRGGKPSRRAAALLIASLVGLVAAYLLADPASVTL
jgi:hypothetical protein